MKNTEKINDDQYSKTEAPLWGSTANAIRVYVACAIVALIITLLNMMN